MGNMGSIGVPEMIFIFLLALLIFGPKKLPELGRSLGKGISEFRRASSELKSSLEREIQNLEQETKIEEPVPAATATATASAKDAAGKTNTPTSGPGDYQYEGYSGEHKD